MKLPKLISNRFKCVDSIVSLEKKGVDEVAAFILECTGYSSWLHEEGADHMGELYIYLREAWKRGEFSDAKALEVVSALQKVPWLLEEQVEKDLTLLLGEEKVSEHSMVIGVLAAGFRKQAVEGTLRLPEETRALYAHLQEFFRTGQASELWKLSPEELLELLYFASQHSIEKLSVQGAEVYQRYLSKETLLETLEFAQREALTSLEEACCALINRSGYGVELLYREGGGLELKLVHLSEEGEKLVAKLASQITALHIEGSAASERGVLQLLPALRKLQRLSFSTAEAPEKEFFAALPLLSALDLSYAEWLTEETLGEILEQQTALSELSLEGVESVDFAPLIALPKLFRLTTLNMGHCKWFGDRELELVASSLPQLTSLSLQHTCIGDRGLASLGSSCSSMSFLDISYCYSVTFDGLYAFAERTPYLERCRVYGCPKIPANFPQKLAHLWPRLK